MNSIPLTATQTFVLSAAAKHPDLRVEAFPEQVKGGARIKVLAALLTRCLIRSEGDHLVLTAAGLSALGHGEPTALTHIDEAALEPVIAVSEADSDSASPDAPKPVPSQPAHLRACTKQAALIEMLIRPQGASIAQLTEALGWQAHSVRGALVNVPRKFGLTLQGEKVGGVRIYRVQAEAQPHSHAEVTP